MDPVDDPLPQSGVDSAVPCDSALSVECAGPDDDTPMAFAGPVVAGMSRMAVTVIDDVQRAWRKSLCQRVANFGFKCHYFVLPPSILCVLP